MFRNIAGGIAVLGTSGLIGYALYITKDLNCLWAIILLIILGECFPWAKER